MTTIEFQITRTNKFERDGKTTVFFDMDIRTKDGILVTLADMRLAENKEGKKFISGPSKEFTVKNDQGAEEKRWKKYVKIWPEQQNWGRQDAIVQKVLEEAAKGDGQSSSPAPSSSSSETTSGIW